MMDGHLLDTAPRTASLDVATTVESLDLGPIQTAEGVAPAALLGALAVLALLDSTSFGTLLIPLWLLMAPGRVRVGRLLGYLGVVAGTYAVIGVVLLACLSLFGERLISWVDAARASPVAQVLQLVLAAGLILWSLRLDPMTRAGKEARRRREEARGTAERMARFRARAVGADGATGPGPLLALAGTAVILELPTLVPYLAGIGLVAGQGPGWPAGSPMILFYCAVMIAPALVLLLARVVAHRLIAAPLERLEAWLSRHANATIALILFLAGLYLGLGALRGLGVTG